MHEGSPPIAALVVDICCFEESLEQVWVCGLGIGEVEDEEGAAEGVDRGGGVVGPVVELSSVTFVDILENKLVSNHLNKIKIKL